jgi:tricarboxylate carrier
VDLVVKFDPATLLQSDTAIRAAQQRVEARHGSDRELWADRELVESAVHPDTGEIVLQPFRMSGYVPYNAPMCAAMVMVSSPAGQGFWNWMNQSHNAAVNYANRNATSPVSTESLVVSYCGAVGSAVGVALALGGAIRRFAPPRLVPRLMKFVAFPASAFASSANCYIMRRAEMVEGITMQDEQGREVGSGKRSVVAATRAVKETVMSRMVLPVPVVLLPAVVMNMPGLSSLPPGVSVPLAMYVTTVAFGLGLPAVVAYFPQYSRIHVSELEPEFQQLRDAEGQPLEVLYFNKGL